MIFEFVKLCFQDFIGKQDDTSPPHLVFRTVYEEVLKSAEK